MISRLIIKIKSLFSVVPEEGTAPTETVSTTRHVFAAYSDGDYNKWKTTLEHVVSRSRPTSQWAESAVSTTSLGQDSVFNTSEGSDSISYHQRIIPEVCALLLKFFASKLFCYIARGLMVEQSTECSI